MCNILLVWQLSYQDSHVGSGSVTSAEPHLSEPPGDRADTPLAGKPRVSPPAPRLSTRTDRAETMEAKIRSTQEQIWGIPGL